MPDQTVDARADLADRAFRALASRPRRRILLMLAAGEAQEQACCTATEVCACTFSERLGLSASTISHHMKVLQEAGLVTSRKDGLWVFYSLRPQVITAIATELGTLLSGCCEPTPER